MGSVQAENLPKTGITDSIESLGSSCSSLSSSQLDVQCSHTIQLVKSETYQNSDGLYKSQTIAEELSAIRRSNMVSKFDNNNSVAKNIQSIIADKIGGSPTQQPKITANKLSGKYGDIKNVLEAKFAPKTPVSVTNCDVVDGKAQGGASSLIDQYAATRSTIILQQAVDNAAIDDSFAWLDAQGQYAQQPAEALAQRVR